MRGRGFMRGLLAQVRAEGFSGIKTVFDDACPVRALVFQRTVPTAAAGPRAPVPSPPQTLSRQAWQLRAAGFVLAVASRF